jgi:hypothetical protein
MAFSAKSLDLAQLFLEMQALCSACFSRLWQNSLVSFGYWPAPIDS